MSAVIQVCVMVLVLVWKKKWFVKSLQQVNISVIVIIWYGDDNNINNIYVERLYSYYR